MWVTLIILICLAASLPVAEASEQNQYQGRRVEEVLHQLQAEGEKILYSSTLVPPDLRVKSEPRGRTRREIAEQILAAHGLTLANGPGDTWLVVRATTIRPRPQSSNRETATRPTEDPTDPATPTIRFEEQVEVIDHFGDLAGEPSVYQLEVGKVFETAGGLENVFQVLSTLPGVAATDDEQGKLAVRGAGPEHNVILFDGVQIHSPQRIGDFGTSFVNPSTTGSIALDASGLDARYGGRLSSVTVLETRDGAIDRRLAISGSAGLTSGDLLVEGRLPGTTSGSWWATTRGTYYKYVAERFRDGDIPGFGDAQFKIAARPTAHTRLSLLGLVGRETMLRPFVGVADPRYIEGNVSRELAIDNRLAAANLWWTPSARLSTTTTVTGYSNASRYQDHFKHRPTGPFDRQIGIDDFGVRQRASLAWSRRHFLDSGVEVHRVRSRWAMTSMIPPPNRRAVGPDTWGGRIEYSDGPIDSRIAKTQVEAWLQDRMPIGSVMSVEPGVRIDWNSFTGETAVQPRLRITRRIGGGTLWAGLSWQAQTPGYETVQQGIPYYDLTGPEATSVRNERSRQLVAGIEGSIARGATVRIEAYHRAFDRLLVQRLETESEWQQRLSLYLLPPDLPADSAILEYRPTIHPESTGTGRAIGLEVLLQRNQGRVTGWLSYALSKSERELYGTTVPFDFDRRHALGVALNVDLTPRIRASVHSQYATGFPITPLLPEVLFADDAQANPTPPFRPVRKPNGEFTVASDPLARSQRSITPRCARTALTENLTQKLGIESVKASSEGCSSSSAAPLRSL
jgi:TonB-dependent Receptor Plug Domain